MKLPAMAGASSFAHLLGRAPKAAKASEDEDNKKSKRAEDDLDEEKGDGDDEGDGPKDGKSKKGKRAEDTDRDEEEDEKDERDEEEDGDKKGKKAKSKRAKADDEGDDGESGDDDEEGDDESDGADMRRKGAHSARLRERARCAAIFSDAAAGKNPVLAATLAFQTDMPRSQAVAVLRAGGVAAAPRRQSLDDRMASVRVPVVGASDASEAPSDGPKGLAAQIVAAGKKRRGQI